MPQSPDRVYALEKKFPLFPNPQFKDDQFAVALASSGDVDGNLRGVHIKSSFAIQAPFSEQPLPFTAVLDTIYDDKSDQLFPPVQESRLLLAVRTNVYQLEEIGLVNFVRSGRDIKPRYTKGTKSHLDRLLLVLYPDEKTRFSVLQTERQELAYRQFVPLENDPPRFTDRDHFLRTATTADIFKAERDLDKIAALEGAFFSV